MFKQKFITLLLTILPALSYCLNPERAYPYTPESFQLTDHTIFDSSDISPEAKKFNLAHPKATKKGTYLRTFFSTFSLYCDYRTTGRIMKIATVTEFRTRAKEYLQQVEDDRDILFISRPKNKEGFVVLTLSDYESMVETAYLLSTQENTTRLIESVEQVNSGKLKIVDLKLESQAARTPTRKLMTGHPVKIQRRKVATFKKRK